MSITETDIYFCGNKIAPPPALIPILPEIANLVSSDRRRQINSQIEKVTPILGYIEIAGTGIAFDEGTLLSKAIEKL